MAENSDVSILVELVESARGNLTHGDESAAGDLRGLKLPGFTYVEKKRRVVGCKLLFELIDCDFEVHD